MQKHKQERKVKDKWVKSEITKIKLNPEQAFYLVVVAVGN